MIEESFWTPASDWCPHPERWHSPDNESTEIEISRLVGAFVTALQPDFVVETGTAFGQTTKFIGEALRDNGHGTCTTIDTDGARLDIASALCAGLPIMLYGGNSLDYTPTAPIDFAWIDSGGQRGEEVERYFPYFSKGAIIGIHDAGPQHSTVRAQIESLDNRGIIKPIYLRSPRGVAFAQILN